MISSPDGALTSRRSLLATAWRVVGYAPFFVYLVPAAIVFVSRHAFTFTNGWDEESYLSYQGAIGATALPGYVLSWVNVLLHELGLSGAMQNVLLDVVVPVLVFGVSVSVAKRLGASNDASWCLGLVVSLGSILFNSVNPLVQLLGPIRPEWLTIPPDPGLAILRTPHPQLSFGLIAVAAMTYVATKRLWVLFIPVPFVYWAVMPAYLYLVLCWTVVQQSGWVSWRRLVILNGAILVVAGGLMFAAVRVALWWSPDFRSSRFAEVAAVQEPVLTLQALLGVLFFGLAVPLISRHRHAPQLRAVGMAIVGALLFVANLSTFTGIQLNPNSVHAATSPTLVAVLFALLLLVAFSQLDAGATLARLGARGLRTAIGGGLLYLMVMGAGFDPDRLQFRVFANEDLPLEDVRRVQQDPLHALIPHAGLSGKLALTAPRMMMPAFASQYTFSFVYKDCVLNEALHVEAVAAFRTLSLPPGQLREFELHEQYIRENIAKFHEQPFRVGTRYCTSATYAPGEFYYIHPTTPAGIWVVFPDWDRREKTAQ
jgi:hypothetical protein